MVRIVLMGPMWHRRFGSVKARRRGREHGPSWREGTLSFGRNFHRIAWIAGRIVLRRVDQWVGDDACKRWLCGAGGGRDYRRHARLRGVLGVQRARRTAGRDVGACHAAGAVCCKHTRAGRCRAVHEGCGVSNYSGTASIGRASDYPATVSVSHAAGARYAGPCGASHGGPAAAITPSARHAAPHSRCNAPSAT